MRVPYFSLVVILQAAVPALLSAQAAPAGVEFQVTVYTYGGQLQPRACRAASGASVVVWEGRGAEDGHNGGIFGRRYDSQGGALGGEFQVNTVTEEDQAAPAVCCDETGNFVVVWHSEDQDGDERGVFAQRFASSGAREGTEFQVNSYTDDDQRNPAVCCGPDGRFVVTWDSYQGGDEPDIFAQRFDATGTPVGAELQVNDYTTGRQTSPVLCCDSAGDFVIVWNDGGRDGDDYSVFGQRFGSSGAVLGHAFQVNSYTRNYQDSPSICCGPRGRFVVTWESDEVAQDGVGDGIFAQLFAGGQRAGSEFQVNTYTYYSQTDPSVCCDAAGNFAVVWQSDDQDGSSQGVFGQLFDDRANAVGAELQVNTYTTDQQGFPDVACDGDGDLFVIWRSLQQDGSDFGVFGRFLDRVRNTSPVPAASGLGLAALAAALTAIGIRRLLRRRRTPNRSSRQRRT